MIRIKIGSEFMKTVKQVWKEEWVPEIKVALKQFRNPKTRYQQIPNLLTASRLISPLFIIPIALFTNVTITFIVAALFALTDALDGKIARKFHLQSKLGSMLDPVTDKFFAFGLLLPNFVSFPISIIVLLSLEIIIGIINSYSKLKGNHPASNLLGKTKTTFLSISAIAMYLSNIESIAFILPFLIGVTILLQISAAICYRKIDLEYSKAKKETILALK